MSKKSRGTNAERDLIHKFWEHGWAALRAAGSGSSHYPAPDVLASNNIRKIALEVKLTTEERKYFTKKEITELRYFAEKFGAECWVAVKFFHKPWCFFLIEDLEETKQSYVALKDSPKALSFQELISS